MSGLILPSTYQQRTVIARGEDVNDITRSVQDGDMTVGWRGDPSFDVYREGSEVKVLGFDTKGTRYVAATVNIVDPNWRVTLLRKLRDGDWQKDIFMDKFESERVQRERDRISVENDRIAEIADKYVSAKLRDNSSKRYF